MMFSFFKKKEIRKNKSISSLKVDIHSHLIPGIDDGAKDMEESLSLLRGFVSLGYEKVITTPHIMSDHYKNDHDIIMNGREMLQEAAKAEGIDLVIEAAAEYYMDENFFEEMKKEKVLSINSTYVLFETSYIAKPLQIEEMIFSITASGYTPIMAHPERYRYIVDPLNEYRRFKELGVLFQVNINSVGGYYGKRAKELALFLGDRGMIDFLGSDVHHQKHLSSLEKTSSLNIYDSLHKKNDIKNGLL